MKFLLAVAGYTEFAVAGNYEHTPFPLKKGTLFMAKNFEFNQLGAAIL